jgi:hypothetical protein
MVPKVCASSANIKKQASWEKSIGFMIRNNISNQKGEITMFKNKKLLIMLTVLVLSAVLLTSVAMGEENNVTVSGTLKAVDVNASTVTIAVEGSDDLVLTFTAKSNVQIGGVSSDLTQLAAKIDSKVAVEYDAEAKAISVISIQ